MHVRIFPAVPAHRVEYDVFVSYSSEDLAWVKDVLFSRLQQAGYAVCIDFKDFVPGKSGGHTGGLGTRAGGVRSLYRLQGLRAG